VDIEEIDEEKFKLEDPMKLEKKRSFKMIKKTLMDQEPHINRENKSP